MNSYMRFWQFLASLDYLVVMCRGRSRVEADRGPVSRRLDRLGSAVGTLLVVVKLSTLGAYSFRSG